MIDTLVEIEIYTRNKVNRNEFGGSSSKMYRIAFYDDKWVFCWIAKDIYNKLETAINKHGEIFKRYTGLAIYFKGSLYIGITPNLNDGISILPTTRNGMMPRQ